MHTYRNYSPQVVARVIWVTAPSAMSSLQRGGRIEGEKKRRNERNKRTDGFKKQWRWRRALAWAPLPEDKTVLFFSLTLVRWQFRPNSTVAFQVILLKLYNVPFYYTWVSLEKIIVQCEQHWNALIMSYRTFHKCLTCLLTFLFSIKLQRVH